MAHTSRQVRTGAVLAARDFVFGLLLFWGVAIAVYLGPAPAQALTFPNASVAYETGAAQLLKAEKASYYATVANGALRNLNPTQTSTISALTAVGFVFALLTMMNLAFVRHLRRTYQVSRSAARRQR